MSDPLRLSVDPQVEQLARDAVALLGDTPRSRSGRRADAEWQGIVAGARARAQRRVMYAQIVAGVVSAIIGGAVVARLAEPALGVAVRPSLPAGVVAERPASQAPPPARGGPAGAAITAAPAASAGPSLAVEKSEGRALSEVSAAEARVLARDESSAARLAPLAASSLPMPHPVISAPAAQVEVQGCESAADAAARRSCLERAASGTGLAAENAQFALGLIEQGSGRHAQAAAAWKQYVARFEGGALVPEAKVALLEELLALGRVEEAVSGAADFVARFPDEPVTPSVELWRGELLYGRLGRPAEARAVFEAISRLPAAALGGEALYFAALCDLELGQAAAARARLEQYRARFPAGPHADRHA